MAEPKKIAASSLDRNVLAKVEGYFEPNLGQAAAGVLFVGRGAVDLAISESDIAFLLRNAMGKTSRVSMGWSRANPKVRFTPRGVLQGVSGYFRGKDPSKWITRVPHYTHLEAKEVYPGIDLVLYWTAERMLEYDFIVRPGGDPSQISLHLDGIDRIQSDSGSGSLVMQSAAGKIVHRRPRVFQQDTNGKRREVATAYEIFQKPAALQPSASIGFGVAAYDRSRELVIDPVIQFSTLIGARVGEEEPGEIAVDSDGAAYVAGVSMNIEGSELVPLANPWQPGGNLTAGFNDIFISKIAFDPLQNRAILIYSTYLGGNSQESAPSISVDAGGNAYVTGYSLSSDFPIVNPIAQSGGVSLGTGFLYVSKLSFSSGQLRLAFSTRVGQTGAGQMVRSDSNGVLTVLGSPGDDIFPQLLPIPGMQFPGPNSRVIFRLAPSGTDRYVMQFSTYFPNVSAIAVHSDGGTYLTGSWGPGGLVALPVKNPLPGTGSNPNGSLKDAFVAKMMFDGVSLSFAYCTFLGGPLDDGGTKIAVDAAGSAYVAGNASAGFPIVNALPIDQNLLPESGQRMFVAKVTYNPATPATALAYSTLVLGTGNPAGIAVDAGGAAYVAGGVFPDYYPFPHINPLFPAATGTYGPGAFVMKLAFQGTTLSLPFSTIIEASEPTAAYGVAVSPTGTIYLVGKTTRPAVNDSLINYPQYPRFPVVNPIAPEDDQRRRQMDVFVMRIVDTPAGSGQVTVTKSGPGSVKGNAGGINCGSTCTGTVSGSVILTPTPDAGMGFVGWSGACSGTGPCGLLVDSAKSVTATFAALSTLMINRTGNGAGIVSAPGIACRDRAASIQDCQPNIPIGRSVVLTASPDGSGSTFAGWSGACSGTSPVCVFVMTPGAVVNAAFTTGTVVPNGAYFVPLIPCRILDSRVAGSLLTGPLQKLTDLDIAVRNSPCGVPAGAVAYSLNATVVPVGSLGYLTLWAKGAPRPTASVLNSLDGRIKANAVIIPAGANGDISAFVTDAAHLILDINGYFSESQVTSGFHPVTPCRVVDTRSAAGPLGGPRMTALQTREFPIPAAPCGVPGGAAYSLNVTVVPKQTLGYLTIWPSSQAQPVVSTLNALTGGVVANAAIVPAGANGGVKVFVTEDTDVIIDINGYFAFGGLKFYPVPVCRISDTRDPAGPFGGPALAAVTPRDLNPIGRCGVPGAAKAYALNATVIPRITLGYLSLWPAGSTQPVVSTLNAVDGALTSNAAIVPGALSGAFSMFATNLTDLFFDIAGYFAP